MTAIYREWPGKPREDLVQGGTWFDLYQPFGPPVSSGFCPHRPWTVTDKGQQPQQLLELFLPLCRLQRGCSLVHRRTRSRSYGRENRGKRCRLIELKGTQLMWFCHRTSICSSRPHLKTLPDQPAQPLAEPFQGQKAFWQVLRNLPPCHHWVAGVLVLSPEQPRISAYLP